MRTTHRNRCRSAIAALCVAVIISLIIINPCAALRAEYQVYQNGTAYNASIDVANVDKYEFYEAGMLGERIPLNVGNIQVTGNCSPCSFNESGPFKITFPLGNYTIFYMAPFRDYHLQETFETPYSVNITLPPDYDVHNPLLAEISHGADIISNTDNSTTLRWNQTMSFDLRFYDKNRETLLYFFGNIWIVIAIAALLPFIITFRRRG